MTYRHCCVMFMGELQTEGILTARLNNSPSKFIEKETDRLKKGKESGCPCVGQQGSTMVILLAKRHRMNPHNSWCVSSDSHKFRKKKLNSYLLNDFCLRDNQDCINASRKCFKVILNFWKVKIAFSKINKHTHQHEHVPTFKRETKTG